MGDLDGFSFASGQLRVLVITSDGPQGKLASMLFSSD